jgi:hypothetical protein
VKNFLKLPRGSKPLQNEPVAPNLLIYAGLRPQGEAIPIAMPAAMR